jgi:phage terminase large subunit
MDTNMQKLKRYLVKYVDGNWFEHETQITASDKTDAIQQIIGQCRNASHFSVFEIN